MTKLLENIFRSVNIALVNELAVICDRMGIDIWEVVDAAATKPFGFMPLRARPGPRRPLPAGRSVLPLLEGARVRLLDGVRRAGRQDQPEHAVLLPRERTVETLNRSGVATSNAAIAVLGVSYKPDVGDLRESPALKIMEQLTRARRRPRLPRPARRRRCRQFGLELEPLDEIARARGPARDRHRAQQRRLRRRRREAAKQVLDFRGVTRGIDIPESQSDRVVRL